MPNTRSAGGVVVNPHGKILIVSQRGRSWSLPKGHIEPGEDALAAARREIYEESGLRDLEYVRELGSYERLKIGPAGGETGAELKHLTFFLFRSAARPLIPADADIPEARWVAAEEAVTLLTHPKDREFLSDLLPALKALTRSDNS